MEFCNDGAPQNIGETLWIESSMGVIWMPELIDRFKLGNQTRTMARRKRKIKNYLTALLFVSPFLIGFLLFAVFPIFMSLYYSFTNFNVIQTPHLIGFKNYIKLFAVSFFLAIRL